MIRPGLPDDIPALRAIERAAGERFREVGLDEVADDEPAAPELLTRYMESGRCWVVVEGPADGAAEGVPLGYLLATLLDGNAHVDQVTVRPDHQGRGLGRALLDRAAEWGAEQGAEALTLTTFRDVPWNRPLYEHLGFRVLDSGEMGRELRHAHLVEGGPGVDPSTRVAMSRDIRGCQIRATGPSDRAESP